METSNANTADNSLYLDALRSPGRLRNTLNASWVTKTAQGSLAYAVSRILRLPIWQALSGKPNASAPRVCACGAISSTPGALSTDILARNTNAANTANPSASITRPRMFLDDQGDHLAVCAAHRREIGFTRRHNAVVTVLTRIACACGMQAQVHDRQIVDGFTERPGDWVEDTGPTGTSGSLTCCDLTIVGGSIQEAERHKQQKYAALLKAYPPLTLCVVAIGTDGRFGRGVEETWSRWTKRLRALRVAQRDSIGSPLHEVRAAFARAFTAAMFAQANAVYRNITDTYASQRQPPRGSLQATTADIRCISHLSADAQASASILSTIVTD